MLRLAVNLQYVCIIANQLVLKVVVVGVRCRLVHFFPEVHFVLRCTALRFFCVQHTRFLQSSSSNH